MADEREMFDRMLDPVRKTLSEDVAKQLLSLRADPTVQARVEYLADRSTEGLLTDEERSEYRTLVSTASMIAALQAKARVVLRGSAA